MRYQLVNDGYYLILCCFRTLEDGMIYAICDKSVKLRSSVIQGAETLRPPYPCAILPRRIPVQFAEEAVLWLIQSLAAPQSALTQTQAESGSSRHLPDSGQRQLSSAPLSEEYDKSSIKKTNRLSSDYWKLPVIT